MSTTAVDDVFTDQDLADELSGDAALQALLPQGWANAQKARQINLDAVLRDLRKLTPPLQEQDLADVTELRDACVYRTLWKLHQAAVVEQGDRFHLLAKDFAKSFDREMRNLAPTVVGGARGHSPTINLERR